MRVPAGIAAIFAGCLIPALVSAWPWSTDMMNQPSVKPQEPDGNKLYNFPKRSVPVSAVALEVTDREAAKELVNPFPATPASLNKGRYLYQIYCAACHGSAGKPNAPISPKIGAADLTSDYIQKTLTEGWLWGTITFGSVLMPAYGIPGEGGGSNDLSPEERWHVVNYLRHGLVKKPEETAAGQ